MRTMWSAYGNQKRVAKSRKINFEFTFEDWVNWWEEQLGYKWFEKRGRRNGQYVMARRGDKGPYVRGNVDCVLSEENQHQRSSNGVTLKGELHHNARLTNSQVAEIYKSCKPVTSLSLKYGVSWRTIWAIKTGRNWAHITANLGQTGSHKPNMTTVKTIQLSKRPHKELAEIYGLTVRQIRYLRTGN